MSYPLIESEEWVPCGPLFVETDDGFELTAEAQALLAAMDGGPGPGSAATADRSPLQRLAELRTEFAALVDELPAAVRAMAPFDLLDAVETLQECVNVAAACEQAVVAELDRTDAHATFGATGTAPLLTQHLRITPAEAHRRMRLARSCAERVAVTGQVSPPVRAAVAAGQAAGVVSTAHAVVIDRAMNRLPLGLPVAETDQLEAALVELAGVADPTVLAAAGRFMNDLYDPDGPEPRDEKQRRLRTLRLHQRADGSVSITGEGTAGLLAKAEAVLSPLAAPRPDDGNGPDTRTAAMRMYDALEEVFDRLLRSGTLPDSGGTPASVAVTIPVSQLLDGVGRARTDLGTDLSIPQLLDLACEAEIIPVVLNDAGGVLGHGRSRRLASPGQTKALRARDRGCTFPGCTRPPHMAGEPLCRANATTSSNGCATTARPRSTTSPWSAGTTTPISRGGGGRWSCGTAFRGGFRHCTSIPSVATDATPRTTPTSSSPRRPLPEPTAASPGCSLRRGTAGCGLGSRSW